MEIGNVIVTAFIIVIVLSVMSLIPSGNQTGHFIIPKMTLEEVFILVLFSLFVIGLILFSIKKNYRPY